MGVQDEVRMLPEQRAAVLSARNELLVKMSSVIMRRRPIVAKLQVRLHLPCIFGGLHVY